MNAQRSTSTGRRPAVGAPFRMVNVRRPVSPVATLFLAAALAAPAPAATNAPAPLGLTDAVLMALARNRGLRVERLTPAVRRTAEAEERAAFDPVLGVRAAAAESDTLITDTARVERADAAATVTERLPTGTDLSAGLRTEREREGDGADTFGTTAELGVTQALLQGRPVAVNLARLRQARLDTAISEYELRGVTEALVAEVETVYWECALADRRAAIVETSLAFAERQLKEIEQRIRVGSLPETERAAAQAETAVRREALINARGAAATARLRLLRLVDPDALASPRRGLDLADAPQAGAAAGAAPVEQHVALALRRRPDVNQARLALARDELEVVRTRNGLLPKLDVFATLGQTAYAASFGDSARDLDRRDLDVTAGLRFEVPFGNRAPRARHGRALLTREQAAEALRNLEDLARVDVEAAWIDLERTREQIAATATTLRFQEEKVRAERAKFAVGRSTALLVAQADRDHVLSQVGEIEAVVRHLQARVALFRLDGTLLDRRGIAAPGAGPVPAP